MWDCIPMMEVGELTIFGDITNLFQETSQYLDMMWSSQ